MAQFDRNLNNKKIKKKKNVNKYTTSKKVVKNTNVLILAKWF